MSPMKLSDFRTEGVPEAEPTPALAEATVLSFDQTIRRTGWVLLDCDGRGVVVRQRGTLRTEATGQSGWASTFADADTQAHQITGLFRLLILSPQSVVVHEMPAVAGGHRTESSSLAAMAIRMRAADWNIPVAMISAQMAKNEVFGYVGAGKAKVAAALKAKSWITYQETPHNEHEYDALALAVTYLIKKGATTRAHR